MTCLKCRSEPCVCFRIGNGVGTYLKSRIPQFFESDGCGCKEMQRELDIKGPWQCELESNQIVDRIAKKSRIPNFVSKPILRGWLQKSIEEAKETDQLPDITPPERDLGCSGCQPVNFRPAEPIEKQESGSVRFPEITALTKRWRDVLETTVITAADDNSILGTHLLLWTLLRAQDANITFYNLGTQNIEWIQRWGAQVRSFDCPFPKVEKWQVWMKPWLLEDGINRHGKVLWMDSDAAVASELTKLDSIIEAGAFVTNHNIDVTGYNENTVANEIFPPRSEWSGRNYPNTGILGLNKKHLPLISEWKEKILWLFKHKPDLLGEFKYQDQSVFNQIFEGRLYDSMVWNRINFNREPTDPEEVLDLIYSSGSRILHWAGRRKPFRDWDHFPDWRIPWRR